MIRTFIALRLSDALEEGILDLAEELRGRGVRASWARRGTLHLTLRFLGDIEESRAATVEEAIRSAAAGFAPFRLRSHSVGAFPSARKPRVLWVGIEPERRLFDLQAAVERAVGGLGFPRERRPFRAHVTLGRIRDPRSAGDLSALLERLAPPEESFEVDGILFMKSTLDPRGAIHEVLAKVPLEGPRIDEPHHTNDRSA